MAGAFDSQYQRCLSIQGDNRWRELFDNVLESESENSKEDIFQQGRSRDRHQDV